MTPQAVREQEAQGQAAPLVKRLRKGSWVLVFFSYQESSKRSLGPLEKVASSRLGLEPRAPVPCKLPT